MPELRVRTDVAAPARRVWDVMAHWDSHADWMIGTSVQAFGAGRGARLVARTGVGPVGFLDQMVITDWDPPRRCAVEHTGRLVRGTGGFEVTALDGERARVIWWERLEPPVLVPGWLFRLGWPLVRPVARLGLRYSLRRLARLVERGAR